MKSGTKTNNGGTGYTEIIHLLDSSDTEDDDGTTTKVTTTKFRVLEDNCLLILDSDDEDNINQACAATSSTITALPLTGLLATAGTPKGGSGRLKRTTAADKENAPTKNSQNTNADEDVQDGDKKPAAQKKTKFEQNNNNTNHNSAPDDDDVMAVPAPPTAFVPAVAASAVMPHKHGNKNEDDNDEIELVGHTGHNALSDFPHSRENCVQHVFQLDPQKFCPNCYCVSYFLFSNLLILLFGLQRKCRSNDFLYILLLLLLIIIYIILDQKKQKYNSLCVIFLPPTALCGRNIVWRHIPVHVGRPNENGKRRAGVLQRNNHNSYLSRRRSIIPHSIVVLPILCDDRDSYP